MDILTVIIVLVIVGVFLWLVNKYVPMAPPVKTILNVLVIIILLIWLLKVFGVISGVDMKV